MHIHEKGFEIENISKYYITLRGNVNSLGYYNLDELSELLGCTLCNYSGRQSVWLRSSMVSRLYDYISELDNSNSKHIKTKVVSKRIKSILTQ